MLAVKNKLITILEKYCPNNVYLQDTLNPNDAYPDTFITFFIAGSYFEVFYDDAPNGIDWTISVLIYSIDPEKIDSTAKGIIKDCKAAGFIPQGAGTDVISDEPTHTGVALDFVYQSKITNN